MEAFTRNWFIFYSDFLIMQIQFLPNIDRLWMCDGYFPNSSRPLSFFGYLDVRSENQGFCKKNNQISFPMGKELTVPK